MNTFLGIPARTGHGIWCGGQLYWTADPVKGLYREVTGPKPPPIPIGGTTEEYHGIVEPVLQPIAVGPSSQPSGIINQLGRLESLRFPTKGVIAIVGPSESAKSLLAREIARSYAFGADLVVIGDYPTSTSGGPQTLVTPWSPAALSSILHSDSLKTRQVTATVIDSFTPMSIDETGVTGAGGINRSMANFLFATGLLGEVSDHLILPVINPLVGANDRGYKEFLRLISGAVTGYFALEDPPQIIADGNNLPYARISGQFAARPDDRRPRDFIINAVLT